MPPNWDSLPDELQLVLSREAMRHASLIIAEQAETLAEAIEAGSLVDRGGSDALRLLAILVRMASQEPMLPAGHC